MYACYGNPSWFWCEAYGKAREQAATFDAGTLVLLEGKLRKKKRVRDGQVTYETIVQPWQVQALPVPELVEV